MGQAIYLDLYFLKSRYNIPYWSALLFSKGFHSLLIYRLAHQLVQWRIPLMPKLLTKIPEVLYSISISPYANLEGGINIINGFATVIGPGAVVKTGTIIHQCVSLGTRDCFGNDGYPIIESNCVLGAGAKVLGPITIGRDSFIGANCVVAHDLPATTLITLAHQSNHQRSLQACKVDYGYLQSLKQSS